MIMRKLIFNLILVSYFILILVSALEAIEAYKFIAWRPIPDASGYQIQIKDKNGKIILDKKIAKNHFSVQDLNAGDYTVRTAPLNLFQKPVIWSPWQEMEVLLSETPRVDFLKDRPTVKIRPIETQEDGEYVDILVDALTGGPVEVGPDGKPLHGPPVSKGKRKAKVSLIEIDGDHFLDVTEVEISQDSKKLPILKKEFYNEKRIDVKVDTSNAYPGEYDLTITNPYQKPQKIPRFLDIEKEEDKSKTVSKETATKGSGGLHNYSFAELMAYLAENKSKNCPSSSLPEPVLSECFQTYVTLNSKSKDSKDIFAFYKLISENQQDRMNGYRYFENRCKPVFRAAKERMNDLYTKQRGSLDPEEIDFLGKSVKKINSCVE